jgi:hypothetical protein
MNVGRDDPRLVEVFTRPHEIIGCSYSIAEFVVEMDRWSGVSSEIRAVMSNEIVIVHDLLVAEAGECFAYLREIPLEFRFRRTPSLSEEFTTLVGIESNGNGEFSPPSLARDTRVFIECHVVVELGGTFDRGSHETVEDTPSCDSESVVSGLCVNDRVDDLVHEFISWHAVFSILSSRAPARLSGEKNR